MTALEEDGSSSMQKVSGADVAMGPFGPALLGHWTKGSPLRDLGMWVLTFDDEGETDEWTLHYEEAVYVISGTVRVSTSRETLEATEGELLVVPRGLTVRYASPGQTKLLVAMTPINWRERPID